MLFNYALKNGWVTRNPIDKVSRPRIADKMAPVLTPRSVESLLRYAEKEEWRDRLTICVLVLFCGCRVEEAVKLKWSDLHWENQTICISEKIAKKRRARINEISENAMEWFYWTRPKDYKSNDKLILEGDWKSKLSYLRNQSKVKYTQNAMRHSFASYHLMKYESAEKTCLQLGHVGDYKTLFSHYRNLVSKLDADRYFSILPKVRIKKFVQKPTPIDPLMEVGHFFDDYQPDL
jgi:site-specific recombinase XerD